MQLCVVLEVTNGTDIFKSDSKFFFSRDCLHNTENLQNIHNMSMEGKRRTLNKHINHLPLIYSQQPLVGIKYLSQ